VVLGKLGKAGSGATGKTGTKKFRSRISVQGSVDPWSMMRSLPRRPAAEHDRPLSDDWSRRNAEARQQ
jgi:hypothetical protein